MRRAGRRRSMLKQREERAEGGDAKQVGVSGCVRARVTVFAAAYKTSCDFIVPLVPIYPTKRAAVVLGPACCSRLLWGGMHRDLAS